MIRKRIAVNRGWVPVNCNEWDRPTGTVETIGIIKEFEQVNLN